MFQALRLGLNLKRFVSKALLVSDALVLNYWAYLIFFRNSAVPGLMRV